jgi:transcriptional/translational regulatory protein YebC/TACO1
VDALTTAGIEPTSSELVFMPDTEIPVSDRSQAESLIRFVDLLEDLDDVQNVYPNFNIDDDILDAINEE